MKNFIDWLKSLKEDDGGGGDSGGGDLGGMDSADPSDFMDDEEDKEDDDHHRFWGYGYGYGGYYPHGLAGKITKKKKKKKIKEDTITAGKARLGDPEMNGLNRPQQITPFTRFLKKLPKSKPFKE